MTLVRATPPQEYVAVAQPMTAMIAYEGESKTYYIGHYQAKRSPRPTQRSVPHLRFKHNPLKGMKLEEAIIASEKHVITRLFSTGILILRTI